MSNPNENYVKQFDGQLRAESARVPVKVTTRIRLMTEERAAEITKYSNDAYDKAPRYVFGGGTLPQHIGPQAVGRHYFTW